MVYWYTRKDFSFFYKCVLKASRRVNTFRPNHHLLKI